MTIVHEILSSSNNVTGYASRYDRTADEWQNKSNEQIVKSIERNIQHQSYLYLVVMQNTEEKVLRFNQSLNYWKNNTNFKKKQQ